MARDDIFRKLFGNLPATPRPRAGSTFSDLMGISPPTPDPDFYKAALSAITAVSSTSRTPDFHSVLSSITSSGFHAPQVTPLSNLIGSSLFQSAPPTPVGIFFQTAYFSEPKPLPFSSLPNLPGIYAILVMDFACKPRPYRPIYFGKAIDLSSRIGPSHEKYPEWRSAARGTTLYIAYHLMTKATDVHRANVEENLIRHYKPVCNKTYNRLSDLLGY